MTTMLPTPIDYAELAERVERYFVAVHAQETIERVREECRGR